MLQWAQSVSKFDRNDPAVDDESAVGMAKNYDMVLSMLDSFNHAMRFIHTPNTAGAGTLTSEEILSVGAAIYRHEMRSQRPPPCLAVDCTIDVETNQIRDEVDCGDGIHRQHLAVFSLDFKTDGLCKLLGEFDDKCTAAVAYSKRQHSNFPRDVFASSKAMYGRKLAKWRCPHRGGPESPPYKDGALGEHGGCLNVSPRSDPSDRYQSTIEARRRLVSTICWHRRHHRAMLAQILYELRERAYRAAALFSVAERLRDSADVVRVSRALISGPTADPLTSIVAVGASEELGDALLPYLNEEMGAKIAQCNKVLYEWTRRFDRHLKLRLDGTESTDWSDDVHRVEADGTFTMQRGRQIKLKPILFRRFMTHMTLPAGMGFFLQEIDIVYPNYESHFNPRLSSTNATLVFDDGQNTPVPCFGTPALRRHDRDGNGIRATPHAVSSNVFPRKGLPVLIVSAKRLSRDFGKDTKFRLLIEFFMRTDGSSRKAVLTAVTPAFRVVGRIESDAAAEATKERNVVRSEAHVAHRAKVKTTQPDTANHVLDQNFTNLSALHQLATDEEN
mgnify:FL=1|tara:strand:+ start:1519 stop:3198 length:1680 start_codon:yes stop_codon:yes gene_type:complete